MKKRITSFIFYAVAGLLFVSCSDAPERSSATEKVAEASQPADKQSDSPVSEPKKSGPEITAEMMTAFLRFRSAMLQKDRPVLAAMSLPGLENGCAYSETNMDSTAYKLCDMLDEAQLKVLTKRMTAASQTDTKTDGCIYKDFLSADENGRSFSWSVGCIHLIDEEIGEYSTGFYFRKVNGKFRIEAVRCAG
jgi:hypothetical protein